MTLEQLEREILKLSPEERLRILAVMHHRRDPGRWEFRENAKGV